MATESAAEPREFARGIDVSDRQGKIDWKQVSVDRINFAYAIATHGESGRDGQFEANWGAMKGAGVLRGACHFFQPARAADAQIKHFLKTIGKPEPGDLPPALRVKSVRTVTGLEQWNAVDQERRAAMILEWLDAVEKAVGRPPVIFTNRRFLSEHLRGTSALSRFDLWIADYGESAEPGHLGAWGHWKFWRYTESGSVVGVNGPVSMDRFNGSLRDLRAYAKAEAEPEPEPEPAPTAVEEAQEETAPEEVEEGEVDEGRQPEPEKRRTRRQRQKVEERNPEG